MADLPRSDDPEKPGSERLRNGRYRVLGLLGSGSQGETFEAEDATSGARVAIKRFSVRGAKSWKDVELAEREARVLSQLEHPNLPRYVEHFEENGALYLVTEKIEGQTLGELRRARHGLSQAQVLRFLADAAETLSYLHGRAPPLIHRDIKPNNVILRPDGSFALVDFGSVRDRLRPEGGSTVVGTFGYMAPEQFQGRALPASDVYGVGATAIACLTGEEPEDLPHQGLGIDVARALGGRFEPRFGRLLSELLEPNPDRRARDLSQAMRKHFGSAPRSEGPARRRRQGRPRAPRAERHGHSEFWNAWQRDHRKHKAHARFGSIVLLVVLVGLLVARFATFGLFRLFLPVLLGLLALFFGAGLRRAARRMAEIGLAGDEGLRRAARAVRGEARPPAEERHESTRVRVEESFEADREAELEESFDAKSEAELEEELEREPRSRRGRAR